MLGFQAGPNRNTIRHAARHGPVLPRGWELTTYKGKPVDVKQIGRELGVHYVVEGSVRWVNDHVRVNVRVSSDAFLQRVGEILAEG